MTPSASEAPYLDRLSAGAWVHSSIGAVTLVNTRALPGGGAINLGVQCGTPGAPPAPLCFDYTPYYESVSGRSTPYAPTWPFSAGVEYDFQRQDATLTPRVDFSYQGSQWTTMLENFPQDYLAGRDIWNFRLTYTRNHYTLVAYLTNAFNKTQPAAMAACSPPSGLSAAFTGSSKTMVGAAFDEYGCQCGMPGWFGSPVLAN